MNYNDLISKWKTKKGLSKSTYKSVPKVGAMRLLRDTMTIQIDFWRRVNATHDFRVDAEIGPDNVWTFYRAGSIGENLHIIKLLGGYHKANVYCDSKKVHKVRMRLFSGITKQWHEHPWFPGIRVHAGDMVALNAVPDVKEEVVKEVSDRLRPQLDKLKRLTTVLLRMEGLNTQHRLWERIASGESVRPNHEFSNIDVSLEEETLPALAQYLYDLGSMTSKGPSYEPVYDPHGKWDPNKVMLATGDVITKEKYQQMEKEYRIRLGLKYLRRHLLKQADGIRIVTVEEATA